MSRKVSNRASLASLVTAALLLAPSGHGNGKYLLLPSRQAADEISPTLGGPPPLHPVASQRPLDRWLKTNRRMARLGRLGLSKVIF